jgi:hypothetical protein
VLELRMPWCSEGMRSASTAESLHATKKHPGTIWAACARNSLCFAILQKQLHFKRSAKPEPQPEPEPEAVLTCARMARSSRDLVSSSCNNVIPNVLGAFAVALLCCPGACSKFPAQAARHDPWSDWSMHRRSQWAPCTPQNGPWQRAACGARALRRRHHFQQQCSPSGKR